MIDAIKRSIRLLLVLTMSGALALSGCASVPNRNADGSPLSPAQQRMRAQAEDFNQTIAEGAIAGALIGGLLGAAVGGKNRGEAAAIGVAAGAAIGAGAGYYVAKQKEQYATEEARLDSMIGDVQNDNAKLEQLVASTREVIANHRSELARLNAAYAKKKASADQVRRELASAKSDQDYLEKTITNLKKRRDEYVQASKQTRANQPGVDTAAYDQQIVRMSNQIATMEKELAALVNDINVTRL